MIAKPSPLAPAFTYKAVVRAVTDGDTIRLDIDLGLGVWARNQPVRLLGVDTPELVGANREAALRAKAWLVEALPPGRDVLIATAKDKGDKYGRYLADVWVFGLHINAEIVRLGLGREYDGGAKVQDPSV